MDGNGRTTSLDLDARTARLLTRLAELWGVSQEDAVRRAVEQANAGMSSLNKDAWWEAFKELQRRLDLTPVKASQWREAIREARS
jgi:hypothetical protein